MTKPHRTMLIRQLDVEIKRLREENTGLHTRIEALADAMESDDPALWDELRYSGTDAPKGWSDASIQSALEAADIWSPWIRNRLAAHDTTGEPQ